MEDFSWPSGGPFLSHSLEPQYVPLTGERIRLGRRAEDHIVGWSGFKAAWERGAGAKIWWGGSLGARGALLGWGVGL